MLYYINALLDASVPLNAHIWFHITIAIKLYLVRILDQYLTSE